MLPLPFKYSIDKSTVRKTTPATELSHVLAKKIFLAKIGLETWYILHVWPKKKSKTLFMNDEILCGSRLYKTMNTRPNMSDKAKKGRAMFAYKYIYILYIF